MRVIEIKVKDKKEGKCIVEYSVKDTKLITENEKIVGNMVNNVILKEIKNLEKEGK